MGRVRLTTATVEKAVVITHCDCVSVALVIQHEMRMCRTMFLCGQSGYAIFSKLSYKRQ